MLGITSNHQAYFVSQAVAQLALATILSLLLYVLLPDHPSLECVSEICMEYGTGGQKLHHQERISTCRSRDRCFIAFYIYTRNRTPAMIKTVSLCA